MTVPNQQPPAAPTEYHVEMTRAVNILRNRLLEETYRSVMLEAALMGAQERERALVLQLHAQAQAPEASGGPG